MQVDKFILRNILKTLVEYAVIIVFGLWIVYLDEIEFSGVDIKYLIVFLAGSKSVYFFVKGFRKISEFSALDLRYYEFLIFIAVNISIIIVSFGLDYFCIYRVDPTSFSGLPNGATVFVLAFKFFYFSLMIFTNIGIIKMIPESAETEVIVIFEAILSFITIIFVLSDFLSLKESLGRRRTDSKNSD
ncbi:ion transporter [Leptospira stimsonii]|uniref:Ion transporter n=1 Tax=Leptospira stimsonii TaxID=2202203 RepID=A0A4R9KYI8_9LEPT|nr:ion transporter [Leptospira stimsonii]RHX86680.1 ion transporter [Leptospira stimsonii]TGK13332.1 ion transporter [Leptospira stimsonii]TGM09110.1 ion transporter [Leptospira stimsonii]